MRKISRSGKKDTDECGRRGYYRYLYRGTGVDSRLQPINYLLGIAVHEGMASLMNGHGIETAVAVLKSDWNTRTAPYRLVQPGAEIAEGILYMLEECEALCEGLLRGWERTKAEAFHEEFEIITIEKEFTTPLSTNVTLQSRCDVCVRSRFDGMLYVINWKTTGESKSTRDSWTGKWKNDVAAWTETLALEHFLGEKVQGCIYEGMYKGRYDEGKRISPLNYAYAYDGPSARFYRAKYKAASKAEPWAKVPVWKEEFPFGRGVAAWVSWLPEEDVASQFVRSMPINKNDAVVEHWIQQVVRKESDIEHILATAPEADQLLYFSQSWPSANCTSWCPFGTVCLGESTIPDLLAAGILIPRVDHHEEKKEEEAA